MTEIYLHFRCVHYRLYGNAPVALACSKTARVEPAPVEEVAFIALKSAADDVIFDPGDAPSCCCGGGSVVDERDCAE